MSNILREVILVFTSILVLVSSSCETAGYASQAECEANDCTWCRSGAMPDQCFSSENAEKLPPTIFMCGGKLLSMNEDDWATYTNQMDEEELRLFMEKGFP
mmetsp:Transcript_10526/g.13665  ORF Transcript_10526/g.13665 Transcript_10526/m.13665 type:complete len:101 (+) Transcript_10526:30-332(+)